MLKHVELDPTFVLRKRYADTSEETTILVNLFDVDPKDQDAFKAAWRDVPPAPVEAPAHTGHLRR